MFAALVAICLALGLYTWIGAPLTFAIVASTLWIVVSRYGIWGWKPTIVESLILLAMVGLLVALLLPAVQSASSGGPRERCYGNLKEIGLALHSYHDRYDSFPPAVVYDERGRPMHSWRVLLLPFMEEQALYEAYRFDEPWDGPNNRQLHARMPRTFRCPKHATTAADETSYVAIVGPGTAWPEAGARTLDEFRDGTANTLLVVETHNSGICWLEPRDLHVQQMPFAVNSKTQRGISSSHPGGALTLRADGSVRFYSDKTSAEKLRALISVDGGETTTAEDK